MLCKGDIILRSDKEIINIEDIEHLTDDEKVRYRQLKNSEAQRLWYKRNRDKKVLVNLRTNLRKLNERGFSLNDNTREVIEDILEIAKELARKNIDDINSGG